MTVIAGTIAVIHITLISTAVVYAGQENDKFFVAMRIGEQYEIARANAAAPYRKLKEIIQQYRSEGNKGQIPRKAAFSAKAWSTDANEFVRIRRDDVPILATPDLTALKATLVLAKKDEVFQFIGEWFNVKLHNPLGKL